MSFQNELSKPYTLLAGQEGPGTCDNGAHQQKKKIQTVAGVTYLAL